MWFYGDVGLSGVQSDNSSSQQQLADDVHYMTLPRIIHLLNDTQVTAEPEITNRFVKRPRRRKLPVGYNGTPHIRPQNYPFP